MRMFTQTYYLTAHGLTGCDAAYEIGKHVATLMHIPFYLEDDSMPLADVITKATSFVLACKCH